MRSLPTLVLFILAIVVIGVAIGFSTAPGAWYQQLEKPWFTPPGWLFGPVWTILYALIGIAGWRVWLLQASVDLKALWVFQMLLNFAWSPVFFGAQAIAPALLIVLLLLLAIIVFIARAWGRVRLAAVLFMPYAAWVGFATALNAAILALNA